MKRLIVALTGATGSVYGVRLLEALSAIPEIESHVIVSDAAALVAQSELGIGKSEIEKLGQVVHRAKDIGASIASGSFKTMGMVIAPCSMKTLASVAHGFSDDLITRAADVCLKERRRLVLLTREAPLNLAHLRNMVAVTEMGGVIYPPVPALYQQNTTIDALVNHAVGRILDLFEIETTGLVERWNGLAEKQKA